MKGPLGPDTLPGLLRQIFVGRKTGELRLSNADGVRTVHFRDGSAVAARAPRPEDGLGAALVRQGLVTPQDLDRAYELAGWVDQNLGQALVEMGAMAAEAFTRVAAEQIRDVLLGGILGTGAYEFEDREVAGAGPTGPVVATGDVILEALRRADAAAVRRGLGDLGRVLTLSTDPLLRFQKLTLTPTDGYVLSRVDGTLSANDVIQLTPLAEEEVQRSLLALLSTGVVEFAATASPATASPATVRAAPPAASPPAADVLARPATAAASPGALSDDAAGAQRRAEILEMYAALQSRNHFEILDVARNASEAEIKAAYFRQAKRFHPDVQHHPALADLRDKLEAVFIRLGQAYDVLRNAQTRKSYEAKLPCLPAPAAADGAPSAPEPAAPPPPPVDPATRVESALRAAEHHLFQQAYWDAIQQIEGVLDLATGKARTRARLMLAKALLKNPHWVKRAEETLLEAVKDDPQRAEAYHLLGGIYKAGGLKARATSMYRKVLELQPEHEDAAAQLADLAPEPEPEPEPEKGGLLKKLFGRN